MAAPIFDFSVVLNATPLVSVPVRAASVAVMDGRLIFYGPSRPDEEADEDDGGTVVDIVAMFGKHCWAYITSVEVPTT